MKRRHPISSSRILIHSYIHKYLQFPNFVFMFKVFSAKPYKTLSLVLGFYVLTSFEALSPLDLALSVFCEPF